MRHKENDVRCKFCGSARIVKRGARQARTGRQQIYCCVKCGRRFTVMALPTYSYPPEAVLSAPVFYYQGYSLSETRNRIRGRIKVAPTLSTVSNWIRRFGKYSGLKHDRCKIQALDKPHKIIARKRLEHGQNYLYQLNRYKLSVLPDGLFSLKGYLLGVLSGEIRINHHDYALRGSQTLLGIDDHGIKSKKSYASTIADIALKAAGTNHQRHSILQKFFIATDRATLAVEVPVYLTSNETKAVLGREGGLLGHIDFLQTYGNKVCIVDYKPGAAGEKHVQSQLLVYAVALSKRTGVHLKDITCAWFDHADYYKFDAMDAYKRYKINRGY